MRLKYVKDLRANIGKRVYWDTPDSARYFGEERSGVLGEVRGRNLLIDGDWKWEPDLLALRDTSLGPKKERNKQNENKLS